MSTTKKKTSNKSKTTKKTNSSNKSKTNKTSNKSNTRNKSTSKKTKNDNTKKLTIAIIVGASIIALSIVLILYLNRDKTNDNTSISYDSSNINVLLTNGDSKVWESVVVSCDKGMTWFENGTQHNASEGEAITFSNERPMGTIIELMPGELSGRFTLKGSSLKGDNYPGMIQLHYTSQGLQVTNYVPLEEYIKGVICSEMPANYGLEALKAQAVCARSYVLNRNGKLAYEEAQANVDDTVSFQVYGDEWATGDAIKAVDETKGMVVTSPSGEIANTMFYSTSCGYTQTQKSKEMPYLARRYVSLNGSDPLKEHGVSTEGDEIVTNDNFEKAFAEYIRNPDENALENGDEYFRWDCVLDIKNNKDKIISAIIDDYSAGNNKVELDSRLAAKALNSATNTLKKEGFGEYRDMKVLKRSTGGAITSLSMEFENGCAIINGELVIRKILGKAANRVSLNNGLTKSAASLYSSAFTFVANENGCHVYGGGFGHGCGMSQDAARRMADVGKNYIEILQFFYKDCGVNKIV